MTTNAEARAIAEAQKAKAALEYLEPLFESLRTKATQLLFESATDQVQLREKLYLAVQTINSVEKAIKKAVDEGKTAEIVRDHFQSLLTAQNALASQGLTRP